VLPLSESLISGLLVCIPFTAFVLISFWTGPRVWLHSLPADIRALAGPKTPREERLRRVVMLPISLAILPGLSTVTLFLLADRHATDVGFAGALLHLFVVSTVVHVWDFVVIDCPHALFINPDGRPSVGRKAQRDGRTTASTSARC
jgi:hypothetical protein